MIWMISANGKMYDHASAFSEFGFIDWRQRAKYEPNDLVYIYCTKPLQKVMYKCCVEKCNMPFSSCVDDRKYWVDVNTYEEAKTGTYARLRLIEQTDSEYLSLGKLLANGLRAVPQGPIKVNATLHSYIEKHFDDCYSTGFFNDVDATTTFHEGHVRSVRVNKYERSSIARMKCIEYHGATCCICGINFGQRYGKNGEGFIHVHHLKPLYTIGTDYVVDYKKDLIPVCPNCHAMIHRIPNGETMSVDELKSKLD